MITITKTGGDGLPIYHKEFMITSASDVASLPTGNTAAPDTAAPGSISYTQDMEHTYLLGPDNVWREV